MDQQSSIPKFSMKAGPVYLGTSSQLHPSSDHLTFLERPLSIASISFIHSYKTDKPTLTVKHCSSQLKQPLKKMVQQLSPLQPCSWNPLMDWLVEDVCKEFTVFKTHAKIWLDTRCVSGHTQPMVILPLLGKEGVNFGNLSPLQPSAIMTRNNQIMCGKPLKAHSDKHLSSQATWNKL